MIGGSGLYEMEGLSDLQEVSLDTPFGSPSDTFKVGTLGGKNVAFLARHGQFHSLSPTEINHQANIYALKLLGVKRLLSASAVGSLSPEIPPLSLCIPDQFVDRTRHRRDTFFGNGIVAHVSLADPFCPVLRKRLISAGKEEDLPIHEGGTYLCMEGPQFSTRAESQLYRSWGMDIIGMTNLTEARLAREAGIHYASVALVTDFDCWHENHDSVTVDQVIHNLQINATHAKQLIRTVLKQEETNHPESCECALALRSAIITPKEAWPEDTRHRLAPFLNPQGPEL